MGYTKATFGTIQRHGMALGVHYIDSYEGYMKAIFGNRLGVPPRNP